MKPIIIAIITICFTTLFTYCKDIPTVDPPQIKIYSEWTNYYDKDNFETHYAINSLATDSNNNMIFSAYIRRNNFTFNRTWIFAVKNNSIFPVDSMTLFNDFKNTVWRNQDYTKNIWYNDQLLISYDNEESWYVTSLRKNDQSSRYQIDKYKNLWITSSIATIKSDGLKKYDGQNWTTYFKGSTFYTLCFDLNGNLYASTLPDFDEPGVIMRYNYSVWETVFNMFR